MFPRFPVRNKPEQPGLVHVEDDDDNSKPSHEDKEQNSNQRPAERFSSVGVKSAEGAAGSELDAVLEARVPPESWPGVM